MLLRNNKRARVVPEAPREKAAASETDAEKDRQRPTALSRTEYKAQSRDELRALLRRRGERVSATLGRGALIERLCAPLPTAPLPARSSPPPMARLLTVMPPHALVVPVTQFLSLCNVGRLAQTCAAMRALTTLRLGASRDGASQALALREVLAGRLQLTTAHDWRWLLETTRRLAVVRLPRSLSAAHARLVLPRLPPQLRAFAASNLASNEVRVLLATCPALEQLSLRNLETSDADLAWPAAAAPALRVLCLRGVHGELLERLMRAAPRLERLALDGDASTRALEALRHGPRLRELYIHGTRLDWFELAGALGPAVCGQLETLTLPGGLRCEPTSPAAAGCGLEVHLPALRQLTTGTTGLLDHLAAPRLETLTVALTDLQGERTALLLLRLAAQCPALTRLRILDKNGPPAPGTVAAQRGQEPQLRLAVALSTRELASARDRTLVWPWPQLRTLLFVSAGHDHKTPKAAAACPLRALLWPRTSARLARPGLDVFCHGKPRMFGAQAPFVSSLESLFALRPALGIK